MRITGLTYGTSSEPICSESFDAHQDPQFSSNHRRRTHRHRYSHLRGRIFRRSYPRLHPYQGTTWSVMLTLEAYYWVLKGASN
jgi:hypothetical protein